MRLRYSAITLVCALLLVASFTVGFVSMIASGLPRLPGTPIHPTFLAGIAVDMLFFGTLMLGFDRGGIEENHARRVARLLVLLRVPFGVVGVQEGAGHLTAGRMHISKRPLTMPSRWLSCTTTDRAENS